MRARPSSPTGSGCRFEMSHLWSGRFAGEPDPGVFEFGRSFPFDRRLIEDDIRGSLAWVDAIAAAGAIGPDDAVAIANGLHGHPGGRSPGPVQRGRSGRGCARVRRAEARRADRRGRQAPAHGTVAKRAGVGRSAPVSEAAHTGRPARDREARRRDRRSGRARGRRADARLYPSAARAAGARRALLAGARGGPPPGPPAVRPRRRGRRQPAAGIRRGRRHELSDRRRGDRARPRVRAHRRQQHRRLVGPRLRVGLPARVRARDGAPQPARRGPRDLHGRGVPVLRAVRRGGDRQQPDAAEEEPGPAGARPRKVRARDRAPRRLAGDDEGAAERVQQGPSGRQGGGVRRGGHDRAVPRGDGNGGRGADARRGAHPPVGVGAAAGHRRGGVPGRSRRGVPAGARDRRRDGPTPGGRRARVRVVVGCRVGRRSARGSSRTWSRRSPRPRRSPPAGRRSRPGRRPWPPRSPTFGPGSTPSGLAVGPRLD